LKKLLTPCVAVSACAPSGLRAWNCFACRCDLTHTHLVSAPCSDRPMSPFQTVTAAAAIISMAFIAYATLSPLNEGQEFVDTGLFSHLDHYLAFAIVSGLLGLAYPRQTFLVCILVFGSAVLLELAQMLTPDRHARVIDAARKVIGGTIGIAFARLAISLYSRRTTPRDQDR